MDGRLIIGGKIIVGQKRFFPAIKHISTCVPYFYAGFRLNVQNSVHSVTKDDVLMEFVPALRAGGEQTVMNVTEE